MHLCEQWSYLDKSEKDDQKREKLFVLEDYNFCKSFHYKNIDFEIDYRHYHLKLSIQKKPADASVKQTTEDNRESNESLSSLETSIMSDLSSLKKAEWVLETPILTAQSGLIKRSAFKKEVCRKFFYHIYQMVPEAHPEYEVDN